MHHTLKEIFTTTNSLLHINDKEEFDVYAPKIQAALQEKLEQIYDVK